MSASPKTLDTCRTGQAVQLLHSANDQALVSLLRFGIQAGDTITVVAAPLGGPLVVSKSGVEIALGRPLCEQIQVMAA